MTEIQRFRQCGYDKSLVIDNEGHLVHFLCHQAITNLIRERMTVVEEQLRLANEQNKRLTNVIDKMLDDRNNK